MASAIFTLFGFYLTNLVDPIEDFCYNFFGL